MSWLKSTLSAIKRNDPAYPGTIQALFLYPGFYILLLHRVGHFLYRHHLRFIARLLSQLGRLLTNIEIHPEAHIEKGVFIDHGTGVVIGETASIGEGTVIYHGVTLGGTGKESGKRHPSVGRNVVVGAGAKILGNIHIGDNSKVAANAVVLQDIPSGATVAGMPAKVVRLSGQPVKMVHKDFPEIQDLRKEVARLTAKIESLETAAWDGEQVYVCTSSRDYT